MKILFLDDRTERLRGFLEIYPHARTCRHAVDAIEQLKDNWWDVVFLDHDLDLRSDVDSEEKNTGMEVVRYLEKLDQFQPTNKVIVHSTNKIAALLMVKRLQKNHYQSIWIPFGWLLLTMKLGQSND